jgi:hypothetical protein
VGTVKQRKEEKGKREEQAQELVLLTQSITATGTRKAESGFYIID